MARPTRVATWPRVLCLLLGTLAARGAMSADSGGSSRYVVAPGNPTIAPADPTLAPADPTMAPGDPTFAPGDPREIYEPSDMTSPRMVRRALRGRSRDRVAPDQPVAQPLRDLTETPVATGRAGLGRRFETLFRFMPADRWPAGTPRSIDRIAPAEPLVTMPAATRTAPAAPLPSTEKTAVEAVPTATIQLTQGRPDPLPTPAPAAPSTDNLAVDEQRVLTLNKPIGQISLIEPVDVEGLRPTDVSAELQPPQAPIVLAGSLFCEAHPARYLYCFTHQPLYFEEANLERCGLTSCCCQPVVSAAQFVGRTFLLPYSLLDIPPCRCVRTLGDCPTCRSYPCGIDWNR